MSEHPSKPLWDAIYAFISACGGTRANPVYGATDRQKAVVAVEAALEAARREAREAALEEAASLLDTKAQGAESRRAQAMSGGFVEALEDGKAHAYAEASDCVRDMAKRPEPEGGE